MMRLSGLSILLLWTRIISLAKSEGPTHSISAPSPQCSYTVTPIKFGFRIKINSTGNYAISIVERGGPETQRSEITDFNQNSTYHDITNLKPCTDYEFNVTDDKGTICVKSGNETKTVELSKEDIKRVSCPPGYVCYNSGWDPSSLLSTPNKVQRCPKDTFCIKPGYNNICSSLTTTFTSDNCVDSFSLTEHIPVDFLNPSELRHHHNNGLPTNITSEFPPNCENLTIDYTCSENGNDFMNLPDLKPFTDYTCTGLIKHNNQSINKMTTVAVRINCDFTINIMKETVTNTSAELRWETTSENCQDVLQKPNKLSYDCSCYKYGHTKKISGKPASDEGTYKINGLDPYTDYTCKVQPKYNNYRVQHGQEVSWKTKPGTPADITEVIVNVPEKNMIHVSCKYPHNGFYGPMKRYVIQLNNGEEIKLDTCAFTFKELSYSTTYTVKVTAFNGELKSKSVIKQVSIPYNNTGHTFRLIFFFIIMIIFASVFVGYELYKRKRNPPTQAWCKYSAA